MRMTIYLYDDLDKRLRCLVPADELSRFIVEAIECKVQELEDRILAQMREGYAATQADRDYLATEWAAVDLEGWP